MDFSSIEALNDNDVAMMYKDVIEGEFLAGEMKELALIVTCRDGRKGFFTAAANYSPAFDQGYCSSFNSSRFSNQKKDTCGAWNLGEACVYWSGAIVEVEVKCDNGYADITTGGRVSTNDNFYKVGYCSPSGDSTFSFQKQQICGNGNLRATACVIKRL